MKLCLFCSKALSGRQIKFCSRLCSNKHRYSYSEAEMRELKRLYVECGLSQRELSNKFEVSFCTITKRLKSMGVVLRKKYPKGSRNIYRTGNCPITGKRKGIHRIRAEKKYGLLNSNQCVHHIDMDEKNNTDSNLDVLTRKEHNKAHASFNKLCADLIKSGIVEYNRELKVYEVRK